MKKANCKLYDILTVAVFVLFIFGFTILFIIFPDKEVSESEGNRALQQLPEFTLKSLTAHEHEEKYSTKINEYYSDQFPFRDGFVNIMANAELAMLKGENNGVLFGKDGQLAVKDFSVGTDSTCFYNRESVERQLDKTVALSEKLNIDGITLSVLIPPRTIDVAANAFSFPKSVSDDLNALISEKLSSVNHVDILSDFRARYDKGEYVYYKTDHHWTTLGAYYCYAEIMKSFGMESETLPLSAFETEEASDSFLGAIYRKAGDKYVDPDTVEYFHCKIDPSTNYTTEIVYDKRSFNGFYDRSYLDKSDHYSSFISGTNAYTRVYRTDGKKRETLLIYKDSFAHSLVPFLALHFDLEIIGFSSPVLPSMTEKAAEFGVTKVLLVYNVENILTAGGLSKLR